AAPSASSMLKTAWSISGESSTTTRTSVCGLKYVPGRTSSSSSSKRRSSAMPGEYSPGGKASLSARRVPVVHPHGRSIPLPQSLLTDESICRPQADQGAAAEHHPHRAKERNTVVDFPVTDEQKNLREMAHDFAKNEMRPVAWEYDKDGTWPEDIIKKAWELQLMNNHIPAEFGGMGLGYLDGCIIEEELAWGCSG